MSSGRFSAGIREAYRIRESEVCYGRKNKTG